MSTPRHVPALEAALLDFGERIDEARQQLYYCDVNFLQKDTRLLRQHLRANLYVQIAAAVESLVNRTAESLADEITAAQVTADSLRISLFSMSNGREFLSLTAVRGLKNWARRCDVLEATQRSDVVVLDGTHVPLDGKTIRPDHLGALWRVFGLPGNPLPGPTHALALNDLADARNDVAHGNDTIARIAGRKPSADMHRLIGRIEEIGLHIYGQSLEYLDRNMYLRP